MMNSVFGYYPRLVINLQKVKENIDIVTKLCEEHGIYLTGVVKGFNGLNEIVRLYDSCNIAHIGDSRLSRLCEYKKIGLKTPLMLIRLPMQSEIPDLVRFCDISLNSCYETIEKINDVCYVLGTKHSVILMADLGDLREGIFDIDEVVETAVRIEKKLPYVELAGLGTNLGCYGAIKPTEKNIGQLVLIAELIENKIGRKLNIISAGATSSLPLMLSGKMPMRANNLRIGEGILLNYDMPILWDFHIKGLHQDAFLLEAQVLEIFTKPSYPIGEIFIDAFGNTPEYEDIGMRKRALIGVGKLDIGTPSSLIPTIEGITIIGGSSDHTILDITDTKEKIEVGSVLSFRLKYQSLMFLSSSQTVGKVYTN